MLYIVALVVLEFMLSGQSVAATEIHPPGSSATPVSATKIPPPGSSTTPVAAANGSPSVFMEFQLGAASEDPATTIIIYISPSCLHCGKFITEDLSRFLEKFGQEYTIFIRFLLTDKQDVFILNLLHSRARDAAEFYLLYCLFIGNMIKFFDGTSITDEDRAVFAKCTDDGAHVDEALIKYQKQARDKGFEQPDDKEKLMSDGPLQPRLFRIGDGPSQPMHFSIEEIHNSYPDPDRPREQAYMMTYVEYSEEVTKISRTKELSIPFMVQNGTQIKMLPAK
jgi:hypothetical protein